MTAWLLKSEPSTYGFDDLLRDKRTRWDGITNPVALKNLRAAALGDSVVLYHTGDERAAVGLGEIVAAAYEDPKQPQLPVVDIAVGKRLKRPVSLAEIKGDPLFEGSPLVRQGRLSVVPLTDAQFARLLLLAQKPVSP